MRRGIAWRRVLQAGLSRASPRIQSRYLSPPSTRPRARQGAKTMDTSIFFGGSAIAAFVAGLIALFAPCCISVMLPAYFASSFRNRGVLVAMTILFAAGIATVILPLAMGAAIL